MMGPAGMNIEIARFLRFDVAGKVLVLSLRQISCSNAMIVRIDLLKARRCMEEGTTLSPIPVRH